MMYRLVSIALLALVIIDTIIILYMKKRELNIKQR